MRKIILGLFIISSSFFQSLNLEAVTPANLSYVITNDFIKQIHTERANTAMFEEAVLVIKKYETIHGPGHHPYIGYGHMLIPEDSLLTLPVTEAQADSILRVDLRKKMAFFKGDFKTRLLLGMLSYNVGQYRLINTKGKPISNIARIMLADSNSDNVNRAAARREYSNWRRWNGKIIKSIERRRGEEFDIIFPKI